MENIQKKAMAGEDKKKGCSSHSLHRQFNISVSKIKKSICLSLNMFNWDNQIAGLSAGHQFLYKYVVYIDLSA